MIEEDLFGTGAGQGKNKTRLFLLLQRKLCFSRTRDQYRAERGLARGPDDLGRGRNDRKRRRRECRRILFFHARWYGHGPGVNGRGTMFVTRAEGISTSYIYYAVDANTFRLMRADGVLAIWSSGGTNCWAISERDAFGFLRFRSRAEIPVSTSRPSIQSACSARMEAVR